MAEKRSIPHLMDEPPISVYPSLAKALGNVNKAIILQQLHFLLNIAKLNKNSYVYVDGKWWVYNSYAEWRKEHFPWLAEVTIKGLFGMLEHDGLVISRQGVKNGFDRRKWYTIDYDAYLSYISSIRQNLSDEQEIEIIPSDGQDLSLLLSETTPETTTDKKTRKSAGYPAKLSEWKQKDMDQYYTEYGTDLDVLVMAWGYNSRFKDQTLTERRLFVQCYRELNDIHFLVDNYVSLASFTRAKLSWKGAGIKPTDMLSMVGEWHNARLVSPPAEDKPKLAHELSSYELQKMQHEGADFEWQ